MVDNELSCFMNSLRPAQKGKKKIIFVYLLNKSVQ